MERAANRPVGDHKEINAGDKQKMKILITGVNDRLGHDVMVEALKREYECFVSDTSLTYTGYIDFETALEYVPMDGADEKAVKNVLVDIRPQSVIDCTGQPTVEMACEELGMVYFCVDKTKTISESVEEILMHF